MLETNSDTINNNQNENLIGEFMQITQFAKKVGMGVATVDSWFKRMEENLIHYVQREEKTDKKVYDKLDYDIACFVRDLRDKDKQSANYSLDAIFDMVPSKFDVRPFPPDQEKTANANVFDIEAVRRRLADAAKEEMQLEGQKIINQIEIMLANHFNDIKALVHQQVATIETNLKIEAEADQSRITDIKEMVREQVTTIEKTLKSNSEEGNNEIKYVKALLDEQTKLLESTVKIETEEEKEKRLALEEKKNQEELERAENERKERMIQERDTHIIRESAKRKVEGRLRSKALELWLEKSPEERFVKNGWFKKEENFSAREKFVELYIADNFEEEYRKEFE